MIVGHMGYSEQKRFQRILGVLSSSWCDVNHSHSSNTIVPLSSDDLEEIDRFLNAWCEENGVRRTDERAAQVASALIDWYMTSPSYRQKIKLSDTPDMPPSDNIEALLGKLE